MAVADGMVLVDAALSVVVVEGEAKIRRGAKAAANKADDRSMQFELPMRDETQ